MTNKYAEIAYCRLCGQKIYRRTALAARDPFDPRPWLHTYGMDYEKAGVAAHNAEPAEDKPFGYQPSS